MSRILLEENLPVPMRGRFPSHEVDHVKSRGREGISNGKLMAPAGAAGFDVFVTADRSLRHQQTMADREFALVVLSTDRWATIRSAAARIVAALDRARPGSIQEVDRGPSERRPAGPTGAT